jgi:hypothetical protein
MGGAGRTHGRNEKYIENSSLISERKRKYLGVLGRNGRITLKQFLKNRVECLDCIQLA